MIDLRDNFIELDKDVERLMSSGNKEIRKQYKAALERIRGYLRVSYDKYAVGDELTYADMVKYDRLKDLQKKIQDAGRLAVDDGGEIIKGSLRQTYRDSWRFSRTAVERAAKRKIRGKLRAEAVNNAIFNPVDGLTLNERLERYRREIVLKINQTVVRGLQEGKTYTGMSRMLAPAVAGELVKAQRIVRTEAHRVMEQGKRESLTNAARQGVGLIKTWLSSRDERVRDSHQDMDGRSVPFDKNFRNPSTGGSGPNPGEMGTAADDINCRCIVSYSVKTD